MLRSISRALVVTALVAAPASAQFGGPAIGNAPFDFNAADGRVEHGRIETSNGITQIGDQIDIGPSVVPTPEPASVALVATGLLGIVGVARRKRNG
jgi:hypothetical protein